MSAPVAEEAATLMPASPSEAAVLPLPTSCTFRFDAVWPVWPVWWVKTILPPSAAAVTLTTPLLLMALSTSPTVRAKEESIVVEAPLRSVIWILPGVNPAPPLSEFNEADLVEFAP